MRGKKIALVTLSVALATASVSACRDTGMGGGIEEQGIFFFQLDAHKDTTARGPAAFYATVEDGEQVVTLYFLGQGARLEFTFAIRQFRGEPEVYDLSLDPDLYAGEFTLVAGGERVRYEILSGTITFEDVERLRLKGDLDLRSASIDGPAPGTEGRISGSFTAVCEGECLSMGPGGPGS